MIYGPHRGGRVVREWRETGGGWGSRKEAAGRVPNTRGGPHAWAGPTPPARGRTGSAEPQSYAVCDVTATRACLSRHSKLSASGLACIRPAHSPVSFVQCLTFQKLLSRKNQIMSYVWLYD